MSIASGREIAFDLLGRLLAGERGCVPLHLGMLLEKSSPIRNCAAHCRWILPPELAEVELSPETVEEITAALCAEISCNPEAAYFSAVNSLGFELPVRTVAMVLANPPRALTLEEYEVAAGFLNKYLTYYLEESPGFLPKADLERLI